MLKQVWIKTMEEWNKYTSMYELDPDCDPKVFEDAIKYGKGVTVIVSDTDWEIWNKELKDWEEWEEKERLKGAYDDEEEDDE